MYEWSHQDLKRKPHHHWPGRTPISPNTLLWPAVSLRHEKQGLTIHCGCMFYFTIINWCFCAGQEGLKTGLTHPFHFCCLQEPATPKAEAAGSSMIQPNWVILLWRKQLLKWLFYTWIIFSYEWFAPPAPLSRRGRRNQLPLLKQDWRRKTNKRNKNWEFRVYCLASNSILFCVAANLKHYCTPEESHWLWHLLEGGSLCSAQHGRSGAMGGDTVCSGPCQGVTLHLSEPGGATELTGDTFRKLVL